MQPAGGFHDHAQALGALFKTDGFSTIGGAFGKAFDIAASAKSIARACQHHQAHAAVGGQSGQAAL